MLCNCTDTKKICKNEFSKCYPYTEKNVVKVRIKFWVLNWKLKVL